MRIEQNREKIHKREKKIFTKGEKPNLGFPEF